MKNKILIFIIGLLVGAVLSTGAFYIYTATNTSCNNGSGEMKQGEPPEKPDGESGEPPEKPSN